MKKIVVALLLGMLFCVSLYSQTYVTRTGYIRFYSEAPLENIEAVNRQVNSALNTNTGEFVFQVLMRSFKFEKALMQEHFNENYVESHNFPNASFQGSIENFETIDFASNGIQEVIVEGELTIKDVTKQIKESGTLDIQNDIISGTSVFTILLEDYDISIPSAVSRNIAEEIEITVELELKKIDK
jgi:polyisoprenoid-binding protein YceI